MLVKKIITVLLMGISIFFIVYFAEKILSFTNEKKSNYSELHEGCSRRYILLREHEPLKNVIVEPNDSYMKISDSLVQKKYRLRVDENGFIMPSKIYDQPDMSIVFLGGSTTECLYMDEENRFPYLTGRIL